ncbi:MULTISPECIES: hypothetical protein [Actinosynnema]|uniref:hypothetical protein n=1 Tax=Actinosynnema TaxID=40566 RepID=UPI0020A5E349|nr:hypothetical protein [Actinosynnema pretiosum]
MQSWRLVIRRPVRRIGRARLRWLVGGLATAVLAFAGLVVSTDPVGYGLPFWPFATNADHAEGRAMDSFLATARAQRDVARLPQAVAGEAVEVLAATPGGVRDDSVWMRVRLHLPDGGVRCREVIVFNQVGFELNSRRVDC